VNDVKNKSLWMKDYKNKSVKELDKNIEVDVLIIGGGMTGLHTAYFLKDSDLDICLVEQNLVGMGVSSRTTGKITFLQELIYSNIEKKYSFGVAKQYLESQKLAIKTLKKIIYKNAISCDLERVKSYVFTNEKKEISAIKYEKKLLEKMGECVLQYSKIDKNIRCKYAISVDKTYVFHPIKYMLALKKIISKSGVSIYENTRIQKIKKGKDGYVCITDKYKIQVKKIVLACHYPFFLKPYFMPLKVYTEKSYITASVVKRFKRQSYITSTLPCKSIRYHQDKKNKYLLYLSHSHNLCTNLNVKKNMSRTVKEVERVGMRPDYIWMNDDMMTVDKIPYIGMVEKHNPNLLIGTGYNTWGMTNSVLAGMLLRDFVLGKKNRYVSLFNPLRVNWMADIDGYFENIGSSMKSLLENKVVKNKKWYSSHVRFENRFGKNVAIYDDGKNEHIVLSTCPHMGCTLNFNEVELTWDCPCHASRFDLDGKCIKGPSCYDIIYEEEKNDEEL